MIYVNLVGRIGNQLFIYAMAEALRQRRGGKETIVFCDEEILKLNWKNSLTDYNLENVEYVHTFKQLPFAVRAKRFLVKLF